MSRNSNPRNLRECAEQAAEVEFTIETIQQQLDHADEHGESPGGADRDLDADEFDRWYQGAKRALNVNLQRRKSLAVFIKTYRNIVGEEA